MPQQRPTLPHSQNPHEQLLARIAQRYEQLEGQLEELETKLSNADIERPSEPHTESDRPRQPR